MSFRWKDGERRRIFPAENDFVVEFALFLIESKV